jgi:RNA polymerase sigma factor (sigma-70 family)
VAPSAKLPGHSSASRTHDTSAKDAEHDREVVAAIAAGDPAGMGRAYDRYAAGLYGYCRWMLHDSAGSAESLQDTFVLAAATLNDLPEPSKLRPWLFALARSECRRRIRPGSVTRDEAEAVNQRADGGQRTDEVGRPDDAMMPFREFSEPIGGPVAGPDDLTMQFRVVGGPIGGSGDATMQFRAVGGPVAGPDDATMQFRVVGGPAGGSGDATMQFRAVGGSAGGLDDATMQFRAVSGSARIPDDATMPFFMVSQLADATMQLRVLSEPAGATEVRADVSGPIGQAELRGLIRSILADEKPREREVIELSFRHDLSDDDLAIVLGVSGSRAHALASRARGRLEKSFSALRAVLAGREACPVVRELLADWDGELTEQTRDLVAWHIEQCQTCANHGQGGLRPTALSGLLPLAPLPPELREQVMSCCFSPAEDAVAHRLRAVRRAESTWLTIFSPAITRLSWNSIRANPGAAIATAAIAVWVVAALSVTLLTFAGSRAAHAQVAQPTGGTSSSRPPVAPASANGRVFADPSPSPAARQPAAQDVSPVRPSPSPSWYSSALPPSPSSSSKPSKPPSPKPSHSSSPKPSPSASPKPSPSQSTSPSPSPSATP